MSRSVGPRYSTWSSPTEVSAVAVESMTFVASSRPPRPASTTATSTPASANATNETAIAASNWVIRSPASSSGSTASIAAATVAVAAAKASGAISAPSIRVRSAHRQTCGEMQEPVLSPAPQSSAAVIVVTEDLPLVPTTWRVR